MKYFLLTALVFSVACSESRKGNFFNGNSVEVSSVEETDWDEAASSNIPTNPTLINQPAERFPASTSNDTLTADTFAEEVDEALAVDSSENDVWMPDNVIEGTDGDDNLQGNDNRDHIIGGGGDDEVWAYEGDDLIETGDDNDTIYAGGGDDRIYTGGGDDVIDAGAGDDIVRSGDGNDTVTGGSGNDDISTGAGDDTVNAGSGDDTVRTGAGDDTVRAGAGDDTVNSGGGADTVAGNAGDDTVRAGGGADEVNGNGDIDIIYGNGGPDTLRGGGARDCIAGGNGSDHIYGNGGNDLLFGKAKIFTRDASGNCIGVADSAHNNNDGADVIEGGNGDDVIYGGHGNDTLNGGSGFDKIMGGNGNDIYNVRFSHEITEIMDFAGTNTIKCIGGSKAVLADNGKLKMSKSATYLRIFIGHPNSSTQSTVRLFFNTAAGKPKIAANRFVIDSSCGNATALNDRLKWKLDRDNLD